MKFSKALLWDNGIAWIYVLPLTIWIEVFALINLLLAKILFRTAKRNVLTRARVWLISKEVVEEGKRLTRKDREV